jgi:hypothetical protein
MKRNRYYIDDTKNPDTFLVQGFSMFPKVTLFDQMPY